ncbi:MAG: MOSC domain-containing protein [Phyllobacteriaceae bacterium]|jgi:hypothetical protein|nr:MOSC domain-containing protein [Phyllobacteriaceae bacterium]
MNAPLPEIHPAKRIEARIDGLFKASGDDFVTSPVEALDLNFEGIPGDYHAGITRGSGGREPWYERGTEMRNERQLSIVARDELDAVAAEMELPMLAPEWIGANMTLAGVPMLSMLPASTLLFFEGGATVKIDMQNGPCRIAGDAIARHVGREGDQHIALGFPKIAKRRRGVVAWVEKPGTVKMGEGVRVQLPEQWVYPV